MTVDDLIKILIGCFCLVLGIWFLSKLIEKTKAGWRSDIGTDVKAYALAIMIIMLGAFLVYTSIFNNHTS